METAVSQMLDEGNREAISSADRRRSHRDTVVANAWLSAEAGSRGRNHHVVVVDLSLHGVGFSCDEQLNEEAVHWIVLDAGGLRASSRVRIASCRPNGNGGYECGAEFF